MNKRGDDKEEEVDIIIQLEFLLAYQNIVLINLTQRLSDLFLMAIVIKQKIMSYAEKIS